MSRDPWQGVWEGIDLAVDICGIYLEACQSSERGSEGRVEWFHVPTCDEAGQTAAARHTSSPGVQPVPLPGSHQQLVFVFLSYFCSSSFSLSFSLQLAL